MIFLIEYDRPTRRTLLFKTFKDDLRRTAQDERLQLELELSGQGLLLDREVVLPFGDRLLQTRGPEVGVFGRHDLRQRGFGVRQTILGSGIEPDAIVATCVKPLFEFRDLRGIERPDETPRNVVEIGRFHR